MASTLLGLLVSFVLTSLSAAPNSFTYDLHLVEEMKASYDSEAVNELEMLQENSDDDFQNGKLLKARGGSQGSISYTMNPELGASLSRRKLRDSRVNQVIEVVAQTTFSKYGSLFFDRFSSNSGFAFGLSGLNANYFHILNFKNILDPTVDFTLQLGEDQLLSLTVNNEETLAIATIGSKLIMIEIDLEHLEMKIVGSLDLQVTLLGFRFSSDSKYVYAKQKKGVILWRIDVSKPYKPKYSGVLSFPEFTTSDIYTFEVAGSSIMASVYYKGIFIIDISDFENSTILSIVDSGVRNRYLALTEDKSVLLVTDLFQGLKIIDVKNTSEPKILSTFVARRQFQDVELRPPQLIFNDSLAVLNTYQGYIIMLDIKDTEMPKVIGHFDSTKSLRFFKDKELAFDLSKGSFELYNMSKVFMAEDALITTLQNNIQPISMTPVIIDNSSLLQLSSRISFHEEANLLIYAKTAIGQQTEIHFYNTTASLTLPKLASIYYPREDPKESKSYQWDIQWKRARPVLNLVRASFYNDTVELELVDISDFNNPTYLGQTELFLSNPSIALRLASVVALNNPDYVAVAFVLDNIQLVNVHDPTDMRVDTRIGGWDGRVSQIEVKRIDDSDILFLMSPVSLRLHNVTLGYFTPLVSKVDFTQTIGNFTFLNNTMIIVGGDKEGIHYIDITDVRRPELVKTEDLSSLGVESVVRVIHVEAEKMLVLSDKSFTFIDFSTEPPRVLGAYDQTWVKSLTQIKGYPQTFYMHAREKNYNEFARLVQIGYPYLLYLDHASGGDLQLGDSYQFLDLYPMTKVDGLFGLGNERYIDVWGEYSFVGISMYEKFVNKHVTKPFPQWIIPDFNNDRIQLNLDIPEALGISYLHSIISLKVPDDAFVGISHVENLIQSIELKKSLIRQGYMERNFLSSLYDPEEPMHLEHEFTPNDGVVNRSTIANISSDSFYLSLVQVGTLNEVNETAAILNTQYSQRALLIQLFYHKFTTSDYYRLEAYFQTVKNQMAEPKIRARLKDYYKELVGELRVDISLFVHWSSPAIQVISKTKSLVKVEIQILEHQNCSRFIDDKHGLLFNNQSMIVLEGSMAEVNKVLSLLRIDLAYPEARCQAEVVINDNLNPIQKNIIEDLAEVTVLNMPPSFSVPLQSSFEMMFPGSQVEFDSTFELEPKAVDSEYDMLSYVIQIKEEGTQDSYYRLIDFVDWIHSDPETGKITGHPSQSSVFKSYRVKYTLSDGYKNHEEEFVIKIVPTPWYFFSMAIKYASGIVFTFGMWKYRDDLYAITFKKKYKYERLMKAEINQNFELIIPIIRLELENSNPIVEHMVQLGLARIKSHWYRSKKQEQWISSYFSEKGFHVLAFINDLNSFSIHMATDSETTEAFSYLGHRIVHFAYNQQFVDPDQLMLTLLEQEIDNQRNWTRLRVKIFDFVQATRNGKMQIGMVQFSENIKIVLGFRERAFLTKKKTFSCLFQFLRAMNVHLVQLPLPTSMPVWLRCEVDSSFIKLYGMPEAEYCDQQTYIRVYDSSNYIIREFEILVEDNSSNLQSRVSNAFTQMLKDKENIQLEAIKQYVIQMSQDYQQRSGSGSTFGQKSLHLRSSLSEENKQDSKGSNKRTETGSAMNLLNGIKSQIENSKQNIITPPTARLGNPVNFDSQTSDFQEGSVGEIRVQF